ncbi:MAG: dipicolinate synthase subunit B [Defluviitaleaceae bacterium]|nr:dipicolinate synthase subunit B [Defluviitaleaceae bacterium]
MSMKGIKIGVALTGSFCNLHMAFKLIENLVKVGVEVTPIISYNVDKLNTRFFKATEVKKILKELTGKEPIKEITEAEPVGPKDMFDVLVVAPATGNTIAKLANAITDTPVLMAIKSQLRNKKPVVIGISTNDGLGNNARNLGYLMNMENVFFVPFAQDAPSAKEMSVVFIEDKVIETIEAALNKRQIQPVLIGSI